MSHIIRRPGAERDLLELWYYIETHSGEDRANALIYKIEEKFETLADHPSMGRLRDELQPGLRSLPISGYLIFYYPIPGGIEVVRVLHGKRNLGIIFGDEQP